MTNITALVDGGCGKNGRPTDSTQHEVEVRYDEERDMVVARIGHHDGSDWPDTFSRFQFEQFTKRVLALFDAAERQQEI